MHALLKVYIRVAWCFLPFSLSLPYHFHVLPILFLSPLFSQLKYFTRSHLNIGHFHERKFSSVVLFAIEFYLIFVLRFAHFWKHIWGMIYFDGWRKIGERSTLLFFLYVDNPHPVSFVRFISPCRFPFFPLCALVTLLFPLTFELSKAVVALDSMLWIVIEGEYDG